MRLLGSRGCSATVPPAENIEMTSPVCAHYSGRGPSSNTALLLQEARPEGCPGWGQSPALALPHGRSPPGPSIHANHHHQNSSPPRPGRASSSAVEAGSVQGHPCPPRFGKSPPSSAKDVGAAASPLPGGFACRGGLSPQLKARLPQHRLSGLGRKSRVWRAVEERLPRNTDVTLGRQPARPGL